jgi:hypothetical protein
MIPSTGPVSHAGTAIQPLYVPVPQLDQVLLYQIWSWHTGESYHATMLEIDAIASGVIAGGGMRCTLGRGVGGDYIVLKVA